MKATEQYFTLNGVVHFSKFLKNEVSLFRLFWGMKLG